MDAKTAATAMDHIEYPVAGRKDLFAELKAAGLVAVFGASDDLIEFRGAIRDEDDVCNGGTVHINAQGVVRNECDNDDCPNFPPALTGTKTIEAIWCPENQDVSWIYKTDIPHETFKVMDGNEVWKSLPVASETASREVQRLTAENSRLKSAISWLLMEHDANHHTDEAWAMARDLVDESDSGDDPRETSSGLRELSR